MGVRIPGLKKYQGRNPNGYFQDLDQPVRQQAYAWLRRLREQGQARRGSVPQWLFAIYVGQARRLALNPPTYEWSCWMNAKKGGYAVQRLYRMQGRDPTEVATLAHRANARRTSRPSNLLQNLLTSRRRASTVACGLCDVP